MNIFKNYKSIIKSLLIIIIILLLLYIFLLNIPIIKEGVRIRDAYRRGTRTVRDGVTRTVDTVGGGINQGFNEINDYTTEVVGDATGMVSGLLGDVLTDMKNAINSLSSKFSQINDDVNYTQSLAGNFGTNTNNAINNLPLIDTPKSNINKGKTIFKGITSIGGKIIANEKQIKIPSFNSAIKKKIKLF